MSQHEGFGVYIHWPFCEAKCPYCDFNSHVSRSIDQDVWLAAYLAEIDRYAAEFPNKIVRSIFFGGGTPSLMAPRSVDAIIDRILKSWRTENDVEITLEANPSSVEADKFSDFKTAGVNRVSLGVQALNDSDLKRLGRLHNVSDALIAMDIAQTTFQRASFDLMYARQDQSLHSWTEELNSALRRGFTHLSLYQLTIEDGTAFGERFARGSLRGLPGEDQSADMYDATVSICEAAGLKLYEVSNFACPGEESRHNLVYWNYGEYVGIGPGAHGRLVTENGQRVATETALTPGEWLSNTRSGSGESNRDALGPDDQLNECLLMGLRLRSGIPKSRLRRLGWTADHEETVRSMQLDGYLTNDQKNLIVGKQYVKVLNAVIDQLT